AEFGSRVEQSLARGVFLDGVEVGRRGEAVGGERPRLAEIVGAVDVRLVVFAAMAIHRGPGGAGVEVRGFNLGDLAPCREAGRGDVGPRLAAVARQVDQAGIAAGPHHAGAQRRGRDGINDAEAEFAGVFGGYGDGGRGFGIARFG